MSNYHNNDWAPIIIVGSPRSGTTLLASMLGSHHEIAVPPETHFFDITYSRRRIFERLTGLKGDRHSSLSESLFRNVRIQDAQLSKGRVVEMFKAFPPDYKHLFRSFLQSYCDSVGKQRPAEKTPRHLEYVETIIRWYPHAKIICIVRDGRDVVFSLMQANWTHNNPEKHAAYWGWCARKSQALRKKFPANFLDVRYEDLVSSPEDTLLAICSFVGVAFDDVMLSERHDKSVVPEWEAAWKTTSKSSPDKSKLRQWEGKDPAMVVHLQKMIGRELHSYGYPLLEAKEPPAGLTNRFFRRFIWSRNIYSPWHALNGIFRFFIPRVGSRERQLLSDRQGCSK